MGFRAVVIGCGNIGCRYDLAEEGRPRWPLTHASAYRRHPAFELVGAADVDARRRADVVAAYPGVRVEADYASLLADLHPDVVSVATPPQLRWPVVRRAVDAGARAVFCEKPLAETTEEADRIVDLCRRRGVTLAVNYVRRWEEGCTAVAAMVAAGVLGRPSRAFGRYVRGLANNGGHLLDLVHWWLGPLSLARVVPSDETASPDVVFSAGGSCRCVVHALAGRDYDVFELDVFFERGAVRLGRFGHDIRVSRVVALGYGEPSWNVLGPDEAIAANPDAAMATAMDDLASAIADGRPPRCTGEDGRAVVAFVDAVFGQTGMARPEVQVDDA